MQQLIKLFFISSFLVCVSYVQAGQQQFIAHLNGANEVDAVGNPNQGDLDGIGTALLTIDDVALTIDWTFTVENIALPLIGAHIHQAPAGVNGGVVVNFNSEFSGSGLGDPDLANVLSNPSGFYVNLHNSDFPGGAIRGQIEVIPEPSSIALATLGFGVLVIFGTIRKKIS